VRNALGTLPWVEQETVQTDVDRREVSFNLKDKGGFKEEAVRAALKDQGFAEMTVKSAPAPEGQ
jgi:hypothetical protein